MLTKKTALFHKCLFKSSIVIEADNPNNAVFLFNMAFRCIISVFILFLSSVIFSIAPHIDYIVHEIAFLLGAIFMLVYSKLVIFRKHYLYNTMASY